MIIYCMLASHPLFPGGNELFVDNAEIAAYLKANDTTAMLQQLAAVNPLEVCTLGCQASAITLKSNPKKAALQACHDGVSYHIRRTVGVFTLTRKPHIKGVCHTLGCYASVLRIPYAILPQMR
jgi:hypothetical protein